MILVQKRIDSAQEKSNNTINMKNNISKYTGVFLLISATLVYGYTFTFINNLINTGMFSEASFILSGMGEEIDFYVMNGYLWFIAIMVILGIFYLFKKEDPSIYTGALIHTFFAITIGLYALMMIMAPNDEIVELIIIVNSWFLIIAGIIALLFPSILMFRLQLGHNDDETNVPSLARKSLLISFPILVLLIMPVDFGTEGELLKFGQILLSLVLIIPFYMLMKWIWKFYINKDKRPKNISTGVRLLWFSFLLGALSVIGDLIRAERDILATYGEIGLIIRIAITITIIAIATLLIYMIGKRKNWARISYLILFIIAVIIGMKNLITGIFDNQITSFIYLVEIILSTVALVFLFQEKSSKWFN